MSRVFLIADTHFNHTNILRHESQSRSRWNSVDQMNIDLVAIWNSIVNPDDRVYHLGDVAMNNKGLQFAAQLNGRKVLIRGNHDNEKLTKYVAIFDDIRATHEMDRVILSHIPVHENQKYRYRANIHGHLHSKRVLDSLGDIDPWYISVSVEQINFTPILFEELMKNGT
jgi:calcineurin-like phosphoesterase family protein